jgi:uncharacterized protein YneF (UPF0154 family)
MANEKNLKPWKKGESGNLKGKRPGCRNWKTVLNEILENNKLIVDGVEYDGKYLIANNLIKEALKDNPNLEAIKIIFDRTDGKATQRVEAEVNTNLSKTLENLEDILKDKED